MHDTDKHKKRWLTNEKIANKQPIVLTSAYEKTKVVEYVIIISK